MAAESSRLSACWDAGEMLLVGGARNQNDLFGHAKRRGAASAPLKDLERLCNGAGTRFFGRAGHHIAHRSLAAGLAEIS